MIGLYVCWETLLTLGFTPDVFLGAWFLAEVRLMLMLLSN